MPYDSIRRRISLPLAFAIFLLPLLFGWILLGKGFSQRARVLGLGWMAIMIALIAISLASTPPEATASAPGGQTTFKSVWGFSADGRNGNAELSSSNMNHFSAGFIGSLLYVHAYKTADGYSVSLEAKHGVFSCGSGDDIYVSFDSGSPMTFTCHETREQREAMTAGPIYLDAPDEFIEHMNSAKTMSVQPLFFRDGRMDYWFEASR